MTHIFEAIRGGWGWTGIEPEEVLDVNAFGNVVVRDTKGAYWRICPEDLSCKVVAQGETEYLRVVEDEEFRRSWEMAPLVEAAGRAFGPLSQGRCYCLRIPGPLGGKYEVENISTITIDEVLRFSGDLGRHIADLPDGAKIQFKIVD